MKFKRIVLQKTMKNGRGYWQTVYSLNPSAPPGCAVHVKFSRVYDKVEYIEKSIDVSRDFANNMFLIVRNSGYKVVKFTAQED